MGTGTFPIDSHSGSRYSAARGIWSLGGSNVSMNQTAIDAECLTDLSCSYLKYLFGLQA
jgi:hypothetical protein